MWEKHPIDSKKSTGRKLGVGWQRVAMGVWWWRVEWERNVLFTLSFSFLLSCICTHNNPTFSLRAMKRMQHHGFSLSRGREGDRAFTCLMIICHPNLKEQASPNKCRGGPRYRNHPVCWCACLYVFFSEFFWSLSLISTADVEAENN